MKRSGARAESCPENIYISLKRFQAGIGYNRREGKENTAQIKEAA